MIVLRSNLPYLFDLRRHNYNYEASSSLLEVEKLRVNQGCRIFGGSR